MKRYLFPALFCFALAVFALVAFASSAPIPETASWNEHADLMTILIGGLLTLVCFFMLRTLTKIDRNQTRLFEKLDVVCKQVDLLQGEHNMMKSICSGGISKERQASVLRAVRGERPD